MATACWLWEKDPGLITRPDAWGNFSASLTAVQDQRLGAEQDNLLVGPQAVKHYLATVERRKFAWFRYVRRHDSLFKTTFHGTLKGGQRIGRQRKCWINNMKEWASLSLAVLQTKASCRKDWKMISAESSTIPPPPPQRWPIRSRDWIKALADRRC